MLFWLLVAYGLMFGLANKLPFLYGRSKFTDKLLSCPYCLGFHSGWLTWLLAWGTEGVVVTDGLTSLGQALTWAFAASAFCYGLDTWVQKLEKESARLK